MVGSQLRFVRVPRNRAERKPRRRGLSVSSFVLSRGRGVLRRQVSAAFFAPSNRHDERYPEHFSLKLRARNFPVRDRPRMNKMFHADFCRADTRASPRAGALRCGGSPARRIERAPIRVLCNGRARAEPGDPCPCMRGPRRDAERFASGRTKAACAIPARSCAGSDQRRRRPPKRRRA